MNKKTAAMVLCTVMAAGVLTGCGGAEEKKDGKTTIKYATYSAGPDHLEDLDKMVAEFEKQNPDIKVETEVIGYDDYFTKLQTQASSKTLPDVFEMNYENFNTYAGNGVLLDLTELAEKDEEFSEDMLSGNSYEYFQKDGKLYGLTEKMSDVVMYYNKDLFDEAGLDYPTEDWTWKEELEAAQTLTKEGVYGTYAPVTYNELYKTVVQNGGALFDENGTPTLGSEENIEAFQWMLDKMLEYNVQPTPEQMSGKSPEDMFKNGEVAMIRTGSWMVTTFADTPFEWDIVQEPGNTQKAHHVFADAVVGSAAAKNKEAVWKFIKFMSTDSTAAEIRLDSSWDLPAVNDESVQEKYASQEKPESREVIFDVMETGIMPPVVDHYSEVQNAINEELNRAIIGEQSGEEALQAAQKKVTDILK